MASTPLHYHRAPVRTGKDFYEHVDRECTDEGCDPWHWCRCPECRERLRSS